MSRPMLLPAAARIGVPWRNGGGVTAQVAAFPADSGLADFGWRLSIAEVAAAGPFSRFPEIDRQLMVLSGRLVLRDGDDERTIAPGDPACVFPGERAIEGRPEGGAVRDLNLMVRRDGFVGRLSHAAAGEVAVAATAIVLVAPAGGVVTVAGEAYRLEPLDALRFAGAAQVVSDRPLIVAEIAAR